MSSWVFYFFTLIVTAGVSEELFFRGFLLNLIGHFSNPELGLLLSSVLFGLAHNPLWGPNTYIETFLGGVFGYAYITSGNNLFVPLFVHILYDFATFFLTWYMGKMELNDQIKSAINKQVLVLKNMSINDMEKLSTMVRMIFYIFLSLPLVAVVFNYIIKFLLMSYR